VHKEIRRRREVVGIFQGRASDICLVGSLIIGETEEWAEQRRSMSARGPCQGPTGTVPRRLPRHGKRPPGVADGVGSRADHAVVHYTTSPDMTQVPERLAISPDSPHALLVRRHLSATATGEAQGRHR
jgi:hypothetical protein